MNTAAKTEEFEHCILCGAMTGVPVSMPIDWRENYEIGVGQVCAQCAKEQRKMAKREHTLTTAQILLAVEESRQETINTNSESLRII